ncbi:hypothetical protein FRX31_023827 [Thalictrum thalictroides]|uniref:Uncharacterized protein n=1 Tax=Thalictrum thalictroides TaxID=46969 RepID=A0A7J6VNB4_THATH|nr:hypothetical protein FRX31_023827 [Thalictrum thalictroides]
MDAHLKPSFEKMKQTQIEHSNPFKEQEKRDAWKAFAIWAYEVGLPFHAVRPPSFQTMIYAFGKYGRVGLYLNPGIYYKANNSDDDSMSIEGNNEIKSALLKVFNRLCPNFDENDQLANEVILYRDALKSFGKPQAIPQAIRSRETLPPAKWWITFGKLQDFVKEGDDLTWSQVEEAMGIPPYEGPSTRRRTQVSSANPSLPLIDEDDGEYGGEGNDGVHEDYEFDGDADIEGID